MSAAALGKAVEVALDSAADISEEVLARDHDATPSVFWPEQRWLGKLLSTEHEAAAVVAGAAAAVAAVAAAVAG